MSCRLIALSLCWLGLSAGQVWGQFGEAKPRVFGPLLPLELFGEVLDEVLQDDATEPAAQGESPAKAAVRKPEKPAPANGEAPKAEDEPAPVARRRQPTLASGEVRLHLMEDSVVSGILSVDSITVTTEFGTLTIPVDKIVRITPGLDSHPAQKRRLLDLIQQLGSNQAKERDEAQKALAEMGAAIIPILSRYTDDADAERRTRIAKILNELEEAAEESEEEGNGSQPLIPQDTVETTLFTVVGEVHPKSFDVQTKFGKLTVALSDIREARRDLDMPEEIRKTIAVSGANLVQLSYKNSGIRVERGDEISITADGTIVMSPWGNNVTSTPDGGPNFQWYIPNKIPGGALVARIGNSGEPFKVGSKHTFTATRSGVLHFAVAMNPQFANQGYAFPGEYNVKIRVLRK